MVDMVGTGFDAKRAEAPRFFAPRLPLFGLLLGLLFISVFFMAGRFDSYDLPQIPAQFALVPEGAAPCGSQQVARLDDGRVSIGVGPTPVTLQIRTDEPAVAALKSLVDHATLFACQADGPTVVAEAGDLLPFAIRPFQTEKIAFQLDPGVTYHLQMIQDAAISQNVRVTTEEGFLRQSQRQLQVRLAVYGALAMIITYNIVLSVVAGHAAFAFNAAMSFSILCLDVYISGFGSAYVWPEYPQISNRVLAFGLAGPTLFGAFFVSTFLGREGGQGYRAPDIWGWAAGSVLCLFGALFIAETPFFIAVTALWIVMTLYFIYRLLVALRTGDERARILLVPLLGVMAPAMIIGSAHSWFQPDFGPLQDHITEIAMLLEALIFTLALAYLMRLARWREATALKALNAHATEARSAMLVAIDKDRTRLAGELHDSAGQALILAGTELKRIGSDLDPAARARVSGVGQMIGETLGDLRQISHDLHPATLDHLGLAGAVEAMVDAARLSTGRQIDSRIALDDDLHDASRALHLYRIAQELLNNALKHSGEGVIEIFMTDEIAGTGIAVSNPVPVRAAPPTRGGIGNAILRERVEALGGAMTDALEVSRFTVQVEIPA